jgi:hypothetical protein
MGHERIGFLPKTQSWNKIVGLLSQFDNNPEIVSSIANQTLENVRNIYKTMPYDTSVIRAIQFLTILSISAKNDNQELFMKDNGIDIDNNISLFTLAHCVKNFINIETDSMEINKIVCDALLETIAKYEHRNKNDQNELFENVKENIWSKIGSGSKFCELARDFFASFTDRHLRYYIDRVAAHNINSLNKFDVFQKTLNAQIEQHSFETSKIMQSFAAGWFNKYSNGGIPTENEIKSFLKLSFEKMREEFRREAVKQ